ncbi:unnamed protein product [Meganyctiphanes norvegica]|uniref:RWD domain-containing protein 3 n=1 Tax=Meganyctiphanes norvegica TaxID=48144 RepID=A0AAV2PH79_MEGNR
MDELIDEVEAIEAIYCGPGEFQRHSTGEDSLVFSVTINPLDDSDIKITITFTLASETYPSIPPQFSIKCCSLTRSECERVKKFLTEIAEDHKGTPMVLEILTQLQQMSDIKNSLESIKCNDEEIKDKSLYILQLDHMRLKNRYKKTIQSWCNELNLVGCLIFCLKWIFIILNGEEVDIKTYIQRNKTQCVDVDSAGRPCKERLLSILHNEKQNCLLFSEFNVYEFSTLEELRSFIVESDVSHLFVNIFKPKLYPTACGIDEIMSKS